MCEIDTKALPKESKGALQPKQKYKEKLGEMQMFENKERKIDMNLDRECMHFAISFQISTEKQQTM